MAAERPSRGGAAEARPPLERRAFLVPREVPALVSGMLIGRAASLRRVQGARKGGRYGVGLAAATALLAFPWSWLVAALAAHLVLTAASYAAIAARFTRSGSPVSAYQYLRLASWAIAAPLAVASVVRLAVPADADLLHLRFRPADGGGERGEVF